MTTSYYKTLRRTDRPNVYRSLTDAHGAIDYPLGQWIDVPGNGAYVAELGGDVFSAGVGDVLARVQVAVGSGIPLKAAHLPFGVRGYRRVRLVEILPWAAIPPEQGYWRYRAALDLDLPAEDRRALVLGIAPEQVRWRYLAARDLDLPIEDRRALMESVR